MLAIFKNVLQWDGAYKILLTTVESYFPTSQATVVAGLDKSVRMLGHSVQWGSLLWVLLGAAGVFVPLEMALNRLWKVQEDRPYWLNQVVGFTLTIVCVLLGLFFLSISALLHEIVSHLYFETVKDILSFLIIRITMPCLFVVEYFCALQIFAQYENSCEPGAARRHCGGCDGGNGPGCLYAHGSRLIPTQGPFSISVSFLLLVYFETFVVLGCAFLATQTERYPWMGFLKRKTTDPVE